MKNLKFGVISIALSAGLATGLVPADVAEATDGVAKIKYYPAEDWQQATAEAVNLDQKKITSGFVTSIL